MNSAFGGDISLSTKIFCRSLITLNIDHLLWRCLLSKTKYLNNYEIWTYLIEFDHLDINVLFVWGFGCCCFFFFRKRGSYCCLQHCVDVFPSFYVKQTNLTAIFMDKRRRVHSSYHKIYIIIIWDSS